MGAIVDRSITDLAIVKQWLGVTDNSQDVILAMMLASAKELADEYCNNPFLDDDDVELSIPMAVEQGVIQLVTEMVRDRQARAGLGDVTSGVVVSESAGDLSVDYAQEGQGAAAGGAARLSDMVQNLLSAYRLEPGW